MKELILVEEVVVRQHEIEVVIRVKKMLMMSFPCDFSESILEKYSDEFRLCCMPLVIGRVFNRFSDFSAPLDEALIHVSLVSSAAPTLLMEDISVSVQC
ncbi:hypothetical protein P8452_06801 [Trifolium repens]|nr:hypothetical protein P8452_06801 [Trifolium repens]